MFKFSTEEKHMYINYFIANHYLYIKYESLKYRDQKEKYLSDYWMENERGHVKYHRKRWEPEMRYIEQREG
jgi:hypothetical protein